MTFPTLSPAGDSTEPYSALAAIPPNLAHNSHALNILRVSPLDLRIKHEYSR